MLSLLSLGFSVPLAIVGGGAVGYFLDRALGSTPWLALLFLWFGVAAGIRNVIRAADAFSARDPAREPE